MYCGLSGLSEMVFFQRSMYGNEFWTGSLKSFLVCFSPIFAMSDHNLKGTLKTPETSFIFKNKKQFPTYHRRLKKKICNL